MMMIARTLFLIFALAFVAEARLFSRRTSTSSPSYYESPTASPSYQPATPSPSTLSPTSTIAPTSTASPSACTTNTCDAVGAWQAINDKKGGGGEEAPEDWEPYPGSGTTEGDIDWLYCWDEGSDPLNVGDGIISLVACFNDFLTAKEKKDIVDCCKDKPNDLEKALCAGEKVRDTLDDDPDNVCRHHAIALESVLETLGIDAGIEVSYKNGVGHAWTEIEIGGTRYLLDSYNDIYICVDP